jgi:hypothetical protein
MRSVVQGGGKLPIVVLAPFLSAVALAAPLVVLAVVVPVVLSVLVPVLAVVVFLGERDRAAGLQRRKGNAVGRMPMRMKLRRPAPKLNDPFSLRS